jgi:hypothetical protein
MLPIAIAFAGAPLSLELSFPVRLGIPDLLFASFSARPPATAPPHRRRARLGLPSATDGGGDPAEPTDPRVSPAHQVFPPDVHVLRASRPRSGPLPAWLPAVAADADARLVVPPCGASRFSRSRPSDHITGSATYRQVRSADRYAI